MNSGGLRNDIYSNENVLSANTWYSIEVEANQVASGHGEIWINGTSIGSFDGNLVQAQSYSKLILDNEVTGTAYFDDVAVANGYNGPVSLNSSSPSLANQLTNATGGPMAMIDYSRSSGVNSFAAPVKMSNFILPGHKRSFRGPVGV